MAIHTAHSAEPVPAGSSTLGDTLRAPAAAAAVPRAPAAADAVPRAPLEPAATRMALRRDKRSRRGRQGAARLSVDCPLSSGRPGHGELALAAEELVVITFSE